MMKQKILLLLLLCSIQIAFTQEGPADSEFVLVTEFGTSLTLTDSTWRVECLHPFSQLGQGYLPTQIIAGHLVFDSYGRRYRVKANEDSDFGSSTLVIVELQDQNLSPSGVGVIYKKPGDSDQVLIDVEGNTGLAPSTIAKIHLHNILNSAGQSVVDSSRIVDGVFVAWINGMEVFRDTIYAEDVRYRNTGGALMAATTAEEGITENGVNILAQAAVINAIRNALGLAPLDTDMGTYTSPIIPDNESQRAINEAIGAAIESIPGGDNLGNHSATQDLNMGGSRIINLDDGAVSSDAVNLGQLDNAVSNISASNVLATPFDDIESFDIQGQVQEVNSKIGAAVTAVNDGRVWYVSPTGNDTTAQRGRRDLPFYSSRVFEDSVQTNDVIWFLPGEYEYGNIGSGAYFEFNPSASERDNSLLMQDTLNYRYYFSPGASIRLTATTGDGSPLASPFYYNPVVDNQLPNTIEIFGDGDFLSESSKQVLMADWDNLNTDVVWSGNKFTSTLTAADNLYNGMNRLKNRSQRFDFTTLVQATSDFILPITFNTDRSKFTYNLGSYEMRAEQTGQTPRIWMYGTVTQDTIRNNVFSFNVQNLFGSMADGVTQTNLNAMMFILGRSDNRSLFVDALMDLDLRSVDFSEVVMPITAQNQEGGFYKRHVVTSFPSALIAAEYKLFRSSAANINIGNANLPTHANVFSSSPAFLMDTSGLHINIDAARTKYQSFYLDGTVRGESFLNFDCQSCESELGENIVYRMLHSDTLSEAVISGSYIAREPGQACIKIGLDYTAGEPSLTLKNVRLRNDGTVPVIQSNQPCTLYVAGAFDVGSGPIDPDVTFIRIDQLGEPIWKSETFTAAASQTDFTVIENKLPSNGSLVRVYDDSGAKLREVDHYTYVPATGIVTLVTPASAGEKYVVEHFQ